MSDQPATDESCFHCGLPVPPGSHYSVEIDGKRRDMCCPGCQAVAQAIVDNGLEQFYRFRTDRAPNPENLVPDALKRLDVYDRPELQRQFLEEESESVKQASLILEGIVCAACVWLNEHHVRALPGVLDFSINYSTHRARVKWDDSRIKLSQILQAITDIGYVAHPFDPRRQEVLHRKERSRAMRRLAIAGLGAMQVMMLAVALYAGDYYGMDDTMRGFMRWISMLITLPVLVYSAGSFYTAAWRDLKRRALGMDVPVALAITGAFLASAWATVTNSGEVYFDSVTMFTFFLLAGRFLEMNARHRAGEAAEELVRMLPVTATRLTPDRGEETVTAGELEPGDLVLVRPGETLPADGRIEVGTSSIDESLLTGESIPVERGPGAEVIAGAVNVESPIRVRIEKVGEETVLSSIIRLLDRAQSEKPAIAMLADRVAAWFVGALLLFASAVFWWWCRIDPDEALWVTVSVLVVTCPCALSLATPAAITAATGRLTRLGLLTTRGHALETLARATHLVFDKTGTLTWGRPALESVESLGRLDEERCLALAAGLERNSEHPLAHAIVEAAGEPAEIAEVRAEPGLGLEGVHAGRRYRIGRAAWVAELSAAAVPEGGGVTEVFLGDEEGLLARLLLADRLRDEAGETVTRLQALGLKVVLLSGDTPEVVSRVARALGIEEHTGGMLPDEKLARVRELQAGGAVVAMVGDGVNDAPVLAGAQVSLAMGGGTQLAHASADMVLLSENLLHLVEGVETSRRTLKVIRENLGWAVVYNLIALPLAAAGWIPPWGAAIGMSTSSLVVVLNALRLAGRREGREAPEHGTMSPSIRGDAR